MASFKPGVFKPDMSEADIDSKVEEELLNLHVYCKFNSQFTVYYIAFLFIAVSYVINRPSISDIAPISQQDAENIINMANWEP